MDICSLELQGYNMSLSNCALGEAVDSGATHLSIDLLPVIIRGSGRGDLCTS